MSIEQIRARVMESNQDGSWDMPACDDREELLAAVEAVLAEVAEWDKSAEISDNTASELHRQRNVEAAGLHVYHAELSRNHAARIRTTITKALEGAK